MKGLLREGRGAISRVQALAKAAQSSAGRYSLAMLEEKAIRFLPPVPDPDRFPSVGCNYRAQGSPGGRDDLDETPGDVSVLVGHNTKVPRPAPTARLDCEPELVFVIGRRALDVTAEHDETDYIAGITLMAGFTDRDQRKREAAAIGPELVTLDEIGDPYDIWVTCLVNGEERIRVNTGEQVWKMGEILEHFSRGTALEQGDMFSTGGQGGVASGKPDAEGLYLKPGDVVECSIEGITTLRTTISAS
jgi:2-keto-4-pentenoate hydratase/2-oxohepta-3-ene-1,7-dioic acid hydratase in catechol pathway